MQRCTVGSHLEVSTLGLGCMVMSFGNGHLSRNLRKEVAMTNAIAVIGAGSIGQAIARRINTISPDIIWLTGGLK